MSETTPLFVRLPAQEADRLAAAAADTGRSKRDLVSEAVRIHLGEGLTIGRATVTEPPPEVLTLDEAAALLRLDADAVEAAARAGELPGREVGGEWRFGRAALLHWLAG
jgi:excisionase family DNA binding protein